MTGELHRPGVAILASGSGTTAEAFIEATQDGRVDLDVTLVISSKERKSLDPKNGVEVLDRVDALKKRYGLDIETMVINGLTHPLGGGGRGQTRQESEAIADVLDLRRVDHVSAQGYMRIIRFDLMNDYGSLPSHNSKYQARATNSHPCTLPETADTIGEDAVKKALELGLRVVHHTVHLLAPGVDTGEIFAAHPLKVREEETSGQLFSRIQDVEKATLPYVIEKFIREQREDRGNSRNQSL